MRKNNKILSKILMVALCVMFLLPMSVLTPQVEAASETPITETKNTDTIINTENEDDKLALARAKAIDEAKAEAKTTVEELELIAAVEAETEGTAQTDSVAETTSSSSSSSQSSSTTTQSQGGSYVSGSTGSDYLLSIDNPDPNYTGYAVQLSDYDRDLAERIIMGEAGSMGYTGMALVAQCLRDTFVSGGYSDIATVISKYGYYGSTSIKPSQTCKDVVNYIFDQGGSAVQHKVAVFYATNYCTSSWHESQEFVVQYGSVRFFDFK